MIRLRKIRPVAVFELVSVIRSKSWLITTFGMPVFLLMYGGLVSIPAYLAARKKLKATLTPDQFKRFDTGFNQDRPN